MKDSQKLQKLIAEKNKIEEKLADTKDRLRNLQGQKSVLLEIHKKVDKLVDEGQKILDFVNKEEKEICLHMEDIQLHIQLPEQRASWDKEHSKAKEAVDVAVKQLKEAYVSLNETEAQINEVCKLIEEVTSERLVLLEELKHTESLIEVAQIDEKLWIAESELAEVEDKIKRLEKAIEAVGEPTEQQKWEFLRLRTLQTEALTDIKKLQGEKKSLLGLTIEIEAVQEIIQEPNLVTELNIEPIELTEGNETIVDHEVAEVPIDLIPQTVQAREVRRETLADRVKDVTVRIMEELIIVGVYLSTVGTLSLISGVSMSLILSPAYIGIVLMPYIPLLILGLL